MIEDIINITDDLLAIEIDSNAYHCEISSLNRLQFDYIVDNPKISKSPAYTSIFMPDIPNKKYNYICLISQCVHIPIGPVWYNAICTCKEIDRSKEYALFMVLNDDKTTES